MNLFCLASILAVSTTMIGTGVTAFADGGEANLRAQREGTINFLDPEDSTDVLDPDRPGGGDEDGGEGEIIIPTPSGSFVIAYAPDFTFGERDVSTSTQFHNALALSFDTTDANGNGSGNRVDRAHFAQVRDLRGLSAGWTLSLTKDSEGFINENNHQLVGTKLHLLDSNASTTSNSDVKASDVTLDPGSKVNVMIAEDGNGDGLSTVMWGTTAALENGENPSVQLEVPGSSTVQGDTEYRTTLMWSLESVRGNE